MSILSLAIIGFVPRGGIGPPHGRFSVSSLTIWLPRRGVPGRELHSQCYCRLNSAGLTAGSLPTWILTHVAERGYLRPPLPVTGPPLAQVFYGNLFPNNYGHSPSGIPSPARSTLVLKNTPSVAGPVRSSFAIVSYRVLITPWQSFRLSAANCTTQLLNTT